MKDIPKRARQNEAYMNGWVDGHKRGYREGYIIAWLIAISAYLFIKLINTP